MDSFSNTSFLKFLSRGSFQIFFEQRMKEMENRIGNNAFSSTAAVVAALEDKINDILAKDGSEVTVNPS